MTWSISSLWPWVAGILALLVLLIFLDPRRLPRFLQNLQIGLADDLIRLLSAPPFFETAKSLCEASLFAGPTYYGVVRWLGSQPAVGTTPISSDDQTYLLVCFVMSLVGVYWCSHRLSVLARASTSNPTR